MQKNLPSPRLSLPEKAASFLRRIESRIADRDTEKATSAARCRLIADDIEEVYGEAKGAGIEPKALKAIIKRRKLDGQIGALTAKFAMDEQLQYGALSVAFGTTPMGEWIEAHKPDEDAPVVMEFGGITGADLDEASARRDEATEALAKRRPRKTEDATTSMN